MSTSQPDSTRDGHPTPLGALALVELASGRSYPLKPGPNTVGRSTKSDIVIDDRAVSRRHCVVMVHPTGECEVCDADSRNGIAVNGFRVRLSCLAPGDVLEVAGSRLRLTWAAPTPSVPSVSFEDSTLGVVTWHESDLCWHFGIRLGSGQFIPATYAPGGQLSTEGPDWDGVRACFRWIQDGEAAVRAYIARNSSPLHPSGHLAHVQFRPNQQATLMYDDDGDAVHVTIDATGRFVSGVWRMEDERTRDGTG